MSDQATLERVDHGAAPTPQARTAVVAHTAAEHRSVPLGRQDLARVDRDLREPTDPGEGVTHDPRLELALRLGCGVLEVAPSAAGEQLRARRVDPVHRCLEHLHDARVVDRALRLRHSDEHGVARQRPVDEHDLAVGVTGQGDPTCDEALGAQLHRASGLVSGRHGDTVGPSGVGAGAPPWR